MTLEYLEIMENVKDVKSVPRKLRGTLTIKDCDDLEFRADRVTGLSSQEEIAKTRDGKLYRTVGEKKRSTVAYIKVPEDVVDIPAFLYDNVQQLTRGMETKAKPPVRGTKLLLSDELNITLNKKWRVIEANFRIELEKTPAYDRQLMLLMQRISTCFAANMDLLSRRNR